MSHDTRVNADDEIETDVRSLNSNCFHIRTTVRKCCSVWTINPQKTMRKMAWLHPDTESAVKTAEEPPDESSISSFLTERYRERERERERESTRLCASRTIHLQGLSGTIFVPFCRAQSEPLRSSDRLKKLLSAQHKRHR